MAAKNTILVALLLALVACKDKPAPAPVPAPTNSASAPAAASSCEKAKNTCADYAPYWNKVCPPGARCIAFKNSCSDTIALAYNVGCDGDGDPGAPQCACSFGPIIGPGATAYWKIVDGDYTSCLPSWKPPCLTAGLAVLANKDSSDCSRGTRVEFTAGNSANPYGKFDSYNLDIQKQWFSLPVKMSPLITCAVDHVNHDCRPLWCGDATCPDAYSTPTNGGCADGRSPQAGCQDTFSGSRGYMVEYCPTGCTASSCPSCQDATVCDGGG
jgi:hypothetical protein